MLSQMQQTKIASNSSVGQKKGNASKIHTNNFKACHCGKMPYIEPPSWLPDLFS